MGKDGHFQPRKIRRHHFLRYDFDVFSHGRYSQQLRPRYPMGATSKHGLSRRSGNDKMLYSEATKSAL